MGSYEAVIRDARFVDLLLKIDCALADEHRDRGCPRCGGKLHFARFPRKVRGLTLRVESDRRHGLCCSSARCRRRTLPASVIYFDRRVYAGAVVLLVVALRQQRVEGYAVRRLTELFGVDRRTVARWVEWFAHAFPPSHRWQRRRGQVSAAVRDAEVPGALVMAAFADPDRTGAFVRFVVFLLGPDPPS